MKDRKFYQINEFIGLDTENKQIKVIPQRATSGKNFVIDSGTIKTRPAFIPAREIVLDELESVIGYYRYSNVELYITNYNFYVKTDSGTYSTTTTFMYSGLISMLLTTNTFEFGIEEVVISTSDFWDVNGGTPIFREEKECLFIFGLGKIYVFSALSSCYTLYELKDKPINPFSVDDPNYLLFEKLPVAYVPTVFIGDTFFEDVNLLSNKTKYKLFAKSSVTNDSYITYNLPTHYERLKHGEYSVGVKFYKDKYFDVTRYPMFCGIDGENFDASSIVGYSLLDVNTLLTIKDVFIPTQNFVYKNAVFVKKIYGLTKETFYQMKLENGDTVFETIMEISRFFLKESVDNKYITFTMPVKYLKVSLDTEDKEVSNEYIEENVVVYVSFPYITHTVKINYDFRSSKFISASSYSNSDAYKDYPLTDPRDDNVNVLFEDTIDEDKNAVEIFSNPIYIDDPANAKNKVIDYINKNGTEYNEIEHKHYRYFCFKAFYIEGSVIIGFTFLYDAEIDAGTVIPLYTVEHEKGMFVFNLKDYFFDFDKEPSIEVEITFENNPDYNYVAYNSFGIDFGNRLFLSGNPYRPNIDIYNVSNDLLGDGVVSQSYELSYFPSRNFMVVGGTKSAINGYVLATDNVLYITKEYHSNDSSFYIRTYSDGKYFDTKTNIKVSPINNKCIVRFNNDILILAKDGLYGVEITQNVMADERLLKLRSILVNKTLTDDIKALEGKFTSNPFLLENNRYLYIVLGDKLYFVDNKYGYEFVIWEYDKIFYFGDFSEDVPYFMDATSKNYYTIDDSSYDITKMFFSNSVVYDSVENLFTVPEAIVGENLPDKVILSKGYMCLASGLSDYDILPIEGTSYLFKIINHEKFMKINVGDTLYFKCAAPEISFVSFVYSGRDEFVVNLDDPSILTSEIYIDIANTYLYIHDTEVVIVDDEEIEKVQLKYSAEQNYANEFYIDSAVAIDMWAEYLSIVSFAWQSAILDFGSNLQEKTSFKVFVNATKLDGGNILKIARRTMRNLAQTNDIDMSRPFEIDELFFSVFASDNFSESGMSLPFKENNFLYMQITLTGTGRVEISEISFLYKINRMVKTIG